jgi:hypothetical protein
VDLKRALTSPTSYWLMGLYPFLHSLQWPRKVNILPPFTTGPDKTPHTHTHTHTLSLSLSLSPSLPLHVHFWATLTLPCRQYHCTVSQFRRLQLKSSSVWKPQILQVMNHELNCFLLLDYRFMLCKYDIKNTGFVGQVCVLGKASWILHRTPCFWTGNNIRHLKIRLHICPPNLCQLT